jgi:hypothetical protein
MVLGKSSAISSANSPVAFLLYQVRKGSFLQEGLTRSPVIHSTSFISGESVIPFRGVQGFHLIHRLYEEKARIGRMPGSAGAKYEFVAHHPL